MEARLGVNGKAFGLAGFLGAFGIASGGAMFVLLRHESERLPWMFLVALAVAGFVSFLVETMRELVKHGAVEKGALSIPRMLVTILTLMTFELFIAAWHALPEVWHELGIVPNLVLGPELAHSAGSTSHFVTLFALWVTVGGMLAAWLTVGLDADEKEAPAAIANGGLFGMIGGAAFAPAAMLVFLVGARAIGVLYQFVWDHEAWRGVMESLGRVPFPPAAFVAKVIVALDERFPWPFVWAIVTLAIAVVLLVKHRWLFVVAMILLVLPYFSDWRSLFPALGLIALVFAVPGGVLGALRPWLKRPSETPAHWGTVAFLVAAFLVVLTLFRITGPWFLGAAAVLVVTGVVVRRSEDAREWWPLLALAVGLLVFATSSLVDATFRGVFVRFNRLQSLASAPLPRPRVAVPSEQVRVLGRHVASILDPGSEFLEDLAEARNLPLVERVAAIDRIVNDLDARIAVDEAMSRPIDPNAVAAPNDPNDALQGMRKFEREQLDRTRATIVAARDAAVSELSAKDAAARDLAIEQVEWEAHRQDRQFELCVTGSFGYWVAVALMAGYQLLRRRASRPA